MRVLLDECVPRPLCDWLRPAHEVATVQERANGTYDILVTADKGFAYQQNVTDLNLAVIVLPTSNVRNVRACVQPLVASFAAAQRGQLIVIDFGTAPVASWANLRLSEATPDGPITRHVFKLEP